ncbi:Reticulocyte-binding protein 2 a [Balamuthia mandrillaris]
MHPDSPVIERVSRSAQEYPRLKRWGAFMDRGRRGEDRFVVLENIGRPFRRQARYNSSSRFDQQPEQLSKEEEEEEGVGSTSQAVEEEGPSYFAVIDGHRGQHCAEFVKNRLHRHIFSPEARSLFWLPPKEAPDVESITEHIIKAFAEVEELFLSRARRKGHKSGCCVTAAILVRSHLFVANLGDCRAVLAQRNHGWKAFVAAQYTPVFLTEDHEPIENKVERERLAKYGPELVDKDGRLLGKILVSRAFGDYSLKQMKPPTHPPVQPPKTYAGKLLYWWLGKEIPTPPPSPSLPPSPSTASPPTNEAKEEQEQEAFKEVELKELDAAKMKAEEQVLIAVPDVRVHCLTERDKFLVLASDGLWVVLSAGTVIDAVAEQLEETTAAATAKEGENGAKKSNKEKGAESNSSSEEEEEEEEEKDEEEEAKKSEKMSLRQKEMDDVCVNLVAAARAQESHDDVAVVLASFV